MEQITANIIKWAAERQLLSPNNDRNQALKLVEEVGELCRAILKDDQEGVIDGIGDCLVVLTILAEQTGLSLETCYQSAWNEIKDRQGNTVNGTFIKRQS